MKAVIIAALAGSATAFVPQSASKASPAVSGAMEDLKDIAEKSNPVLKVRFRKFHFFKLDFSGYGFHRPARCN